MTLEEFKKNVEECLVKKYNLTITEAKELTKAEETYWKKLLKDNFTPQEVAYSMIVGLL